MSDGDIVGIVIGSVVGGILLLACCCYCMVKIRRDRRDRFRCVTVGARVWLCGCACVRV